MPIPVDMTFSDETLESNLMQYKYWYETQQLIRFSLLIQTGK